MIKNPLNTVITFLLIIRNEKLMQKQAHDYKNQDTPAVADNIIIDTEAVECIT